MENDRIKQAVRESYGEVAKSANSGCGCNCGCGPGNATTAESISLGVGYSKDDITSVPEGANLGLGCGNPTALATLQEGEIVLDLGSGAGFDCFLAADRVGPTGMVIGVDMTHEMLQKARENAVKGDYRNVEFRLGEIEHLPVANNSVDVIISNCVINLSPEKPAVFREALRVLKPGGRLMVSDIVLLRDIPESVLNSVEAYVGCISGAMMKQDYLDTIKDAGFEKIDVVGENSFPLDLLENDPNTRAVIAQLKAASVSVEDLGNPAASIKVAAVKPTK